jgi:hypothetical protein
MILAKVWKQFTPLVAEREFRTYQACDMNTFCHDQVPAGGEQAAVAVLLGHGRGGELDQGDGEYSTTGQMVFLNSRTKVYHLKIGFLIRGEG